MILIVDNYDSFAFNLYQMAGAVRSDIRVVRNDDMDADGILALAPDAVILSPGPGRPEDAGVCMGAVRRLAGTTPILGVCLGHQAMCAAYGATVGYAKELVQGRAAPVETVEDSVLFTSLPRTFPAARYHALAVEESTLPRELRVTARAADGEVMAVEHRALPLFGLQFHPESVMTPDGAALIRNFLALAGRGQGRAGDCGARGAAAGMQVREQPNDEL